jgi:hypothetical protein
MLDITENKKQIISFLRNLADSIESDSLSEEQLQHTGEFFMSYKFFEQEKTSDTENDDSIDIVKFITLGWYIYKVLLLKQEDDISQLIVSEID